VARQPIETAVEKIYELIPMGGEPAEKVRLALTTALARILAEEVA
jgi:hypothetical protein